MFESFDIDGSGELSIEEFARAITQAIVPDEPPGEDDEEDSMDQDHEDSHIDDLS